jgi:hypothetical protein
MPPNWRKSRFRPRALRGVGHRRAISEEILVQACERFAQSAENASRSTIRLTRHVPLRSKSHPTLRVTSRRTSRKGRFICSVRGADPARNPRKTTVSGHARIRHQAERSRAGTRMHCSRRWKCFLAQSQRHTGTQSRVRSEVRISSRCSQCNELATRGQSYLYAREHW